MNVENGQIHVTVGANSGEIWLPITDTGAADTTEKQPAPEKAPVPESQPEPQPEPTAAPVSDSDRDAFERGKIAGLQEAILAIMEKNGPVTDQMRRDVEANVYHDSLINWVKSFR